MRLLIVLCAFVAGQMAITTLAAELPTADEILQIHRANKERLSKLHLQLVHVEETTEARCHKCQQEADQMEKLIEQLSKLDPDEINIQMHGKKLKGEELQQVLAQILGKRKHIEILRGETKPFQLIKPMEFFLDGESYQFRSSLNSLETDESLAAWKFSDAPLTTETLLKEYREVSIFSRSAKMNPASRWWRHSADGPAYIMQKHLTEVWNLNLPPFTDVTRPDWGEWHAYDAFFTQPADKYRVVRQEEIDGRLLTVVDVAVPMNELSSNKLCYRGWLDLERGALPMKMFQTQGVEPFPEDYFDRRQPSEITTTHAVSELSNGAFYPEKTVCEHWQPDPEAPVLTAEEWAEVRHGHREAPPKVVHRRHTWDCTLVEIPTQFDEDFFVISFPEGQKLYDHDAGKVVGALEEKLLVQVGQQAPPLTIARWLDGKERTLDDLRGQVVVLDFWGLWCGACRSPVPKLKSLQEQFKDRPVTFISIHSAEKDVEALAARIKDFKESNDWHYIGAIDSGRMLEDSVTSNAYGIRGFPWMVIIGPDGKVAYVDPYIDGPSCDETDPVLLAEFEKEFNKLLKSRFESVGEPWPLAEGLSKEEQLAVYQRVEMLYLGQQIEAALAGEGE